MTWLSWWQLGCSLHPCWPPCQGMREACLGLRCYCWLLGWTCSSPISCLTDFDGVAYALSKWLALMAWLLFGLGHGPTPLKTLLRSPCCWIVTLLVAAGSGHMVALCCPCLDAHDGLLKGIDSQVAWLLP